MNIGKDLIAASATPLVLAILTEGDSYGYAILKRVGELSGGHLQWTDGMLYPVLHRLERLGYIEARWEASPSGRRRRYYRITQTGRAHLAAQRRQWQVVDVNLSWSAWLYARFLGGRGSFAAIERWQTAYLPVYAVWAAVVVVVFPPLFGYR